jgi:hypothetical protein
MNRKLNKKLLTMIVSAVTIMILFSSNTTFAEDKDGTKDYTHTPFVEVSTATWCSACPASNLAWHNYYASGSYDFEYCEMVADMVPVAYSYLQSHYNFRYYPTSFFDGGYEANPGSSGLLTLLNNAGNRAVYDIEPVISSCKWLGTANIEIDLEITNYETSTYDGYFRVYVIEEESTLWDDYNGNPYYHAFLDFADYQTISINPGNTYTKTITWDGSSSYPGLTVDNCQVIVAVFNNDPHQGYADPPSGNPFTAYWADDAVSAHPTLDSGPPEISTVYATPAISAINGDVDIYSDVTDDSGVNEVRMIVEDPLGSSSNTTMVHDSGDTYVGDLTGLSTIGTYSYYIWTEDINGNQNSSGIYYFEVMDPHISTLEEDWNFVSLTLNRLIDKTEIIVHYSGADHTWAEAVSAGVISDFIFGWNRAGQTYEFATEFTPGDGYWIYAFQTCELKTSIISANYNHLITTLDNNWNIIGSSYCDTFQKGDIIVHYSGADHTWAEAVSAGVINDFIFGWNRASQSYAFAYEIVPGEASWIFGTQVCTLYRP